MLEDENRTCCDNDNSNNSIPTYSYNFTNMNMEESCNDKKETREEMIDKIKQLDFSVVDLAEYLDTHPDDKKALFLHREYSNKLRILKDKYQKVYGPLCIDFPCKKWRWLEEPWPWERGNY